MIIRLFSTYIGHFVIILLNKTNYRMVSSFLFIFAGMEKIYNYYQDIVTAYTRRADNLKKKIHLLGSIRLLLVAGLIAMVWFFKSEDWKVLAGIAVLFTIPFIALRPEMLRRSTGEPVQKRTERVGLRFQCVRRSTGKKFRRTFVQP